MRKVHAEVIRTQLFPVLSSFSKRQREGRNSHKQNVCAGFRASDQTDQSVRPGHHPHPQAFPHGKPQHPGPVAPVHQPAPIYRPHQTSERLTRVEKCGEKKLFKCL